MMSFSAGVTVTYVFLQLLPEQHTATEYLGEFGSVSVLIGFSAIHLTEKWVYHHEKTAAEIRNDFREIHSLFLILYYTAIGLLLYELVQASVVNSVLFFIPVLFHTAISSFSLMELEEELLRNQIVRYLISIAALIGTAIGAVFVIPPAVFYTLLGIVTGMFLYVVIHDSLPSDASGKPLYFLLGLLFYTAIMSYIWLMF